MSPILRYFGNGAAYYWNWDRIEQFVMQVPGQSHLLLKTGAVIRLNDEQALDVSEQLDALIDPPMVIRGEEEKALEQDEYHRLLEEIRRK